MDKLKIYQKIKELSHQKGTVYTRADLAYDLQQLGISNDCFEVGILVWEAYQYFNQDNSIRTCFYDNEKKGLLVDEYQADGLIAKNETDCLFKLEQQRLQNWNKSLNSVNKSVAEVIREEAVRQGSNITGAIIGTKGVESVKQEATKVFGKYSALVGNYDEAKQQIHLLIGDFIKLRAYICDIYHRFALTLVDAFGESIKVVSPELFDFEKIEYLDVHKMLQNVQLDYNAINEKCSTLMSDISDSFAQSLKTASIAYRGTSNKQIGLILAGLNMLSHYMETGEKVANLKQELLCLKNSVNHDVALIKGDMGRLFVIYKSLNDVFIPEAEAFCKFAEQVLSEEWRQLTDLLYNDDKTRSLKQKRDDILAELNKIEQEMNDEELNIGYYSMHITECKQLLDSLQTQYKDAKQTKPSKPSFLKNICTLGTSNKSYNRRIYEWSQICKPLVMQYENLQVDIKLDSDELKLQQTRFKEHQMEHNHLKNMLQQQNSLVIENISADKNIRLRMIPHLEAVISLLRLGRKIAENRLDNSLTKTVSITQQDIRIPEDLSNKIDVFCQSVREHLEGSAVSAHRRKSIESNVDNIPVIESIPEIKQSEHELAEIRAAEGVAIQQTITFLESAIKLEAMKAQCAIAENNYNQELTKLQSQFYQYLESLNGRSDILMKSLQRMNTAQNHEQLKSGFLALADKSRNLFEDGDWEDFINGTKTIEL